MKTSLHDAVITAAEIDWKGAELTIWLDTPDGKQMMTVSNLLEFRLTRTLDWGMSSSINSVTVLLGGTVIRTVIEVQSGDEWIILGGMPVVTPV